MQRIEKNPGNLHTYVGMYTRQQPLNSHLTRLLKRLWNKGGDQVTSLPSIS